VPGVRPPCEMCGEAPRSKDKRFCKDCCKAKLADLREAGYLERVPRKTQRRGKDREQAPDGPQYDPSPWSENAIRALEDA